MKITQRGPSDTEISQIAHNEKSLAQRKTADLKSQPGGDPATVNISQKARELQRIAELARTGDELRADRVRQLKEQVAAGEYHAEPEDVAKSILRTEVTRLLKE
jgi:flagellar biosynthesis anti-sigma factor FlgM